VAAVIPGRKYPAEIVDLTAGKVIAEFEVARNAIAYSPDGKLMAVGVGQEIKTCDPKTGDVGDTLASAPAEVFSLAWSPDGKTLAAGCGDKKVYLLDVAQKRIGTGWEGHQAEPWFMRWSSDSGTLVSGSERDTCVWDANSGNLVRTIPDDGVGGISPDCRWLASRGESAIRLREIDSGEIAQTILSLRDQQYAVVSPDGHFRGSPDVQQEFVYVAVTEAGEQITLTPVEFAEKYGWKNDPAKVTMLPEPSPQQPASSGESPKHAEQPKPAESNP
jgi:WD40 repeat protein